MHGGVRVGRLSGLKLSRRVDTRDLGMTVLRRTPVCGETKFFADITIILSEIHIQLDSYSLGRKTNMGRRQKVEQELSSKSETK